MNLGKYKKIIFNSIFAILAIVIFYFIYQKTNWTQFFDSIKNANIYWMLFAFGINLVAHYLRGARWSMLTEPAGYPLNKRRSFYAVLIGYIVNVGTGRGGELARCAVTARSEKAPIELLIGTVVTERIIDVLLMMCFALLCLVLQFQYIYGFFDKFIFQPILQKVSIGALVAIIAAVIVGIVFLVIYVKKKKKKTEQKETIISRFLNGLKTVFTLKSPSKFILVSIIIWCCYLMSAFATTQALEISREWGFFVALSILIFSAIGIAVPVPTGAGIWYTIAFGLKEVYNYSTEAADTYALFNFAMSNLIMIAGGIIGFVLMSIELNRKKI